ncbi:hypothetical protein EB118_10015 [bacterium]|nr:hypothetical protein [bacterium]
MIYYLYTLVDITATGIYKSRTDLERSQQQNFDTVLAAISLCGNLSYDHGPSMVDGSIFGVPKERCWYFEWEMQAEQVFQVDNDPIARLKESFEYVPFISGLNESVKFDRPFFKLGRNIIFSFRQ